MKKILCIADQIDPVIYDKSIKDRYKDIDFILSAGDLPIEYLDFIQSSLQKPLFFVFGEHYLKALTYYHPEMAEKNKTSKTSIYKKNNTFKSKEGKYIGFKTYKQDNLIIAGISGSKKHNDGKNQFTESQMKRKLFCMLPSLLLNKIKYGRYLDILVSHAPIITDQTKDNKNGFSCFNKFLNIFKPKYMIHGQVHIYDPEKNRSVYFGSTEIINAYSRHVLEIND